MIINICINYVLQQLFILQLPDHDITLEAAWPALFIDHKGRYWDVPESISLDMSSLASGSGFQYHFGIHKNSGHPQAVNALNGEVPCSLMPGLCGKAAFSYEKSKDFWRQKQTNKDITVKTDKGLFYRPSYDVRLSEPHAAISGIIGNVTALQSSSFCSNYPGNLFNLFSYVNFVANILQLWCLLASYVKLCCYIVCNYGACWLFYSKNTFFKFFYHIVFQIVLTPESLLLFLFMSTFCTICLFLFFFFF